MWCVVFYIDDGEVDYVAGPFASRDAAIRAAELSGSDDYVVQTLRSPTRMRRAAS